MESSPAGVPIDLSGQVAIVTGGGRGIGRAVALALAEAGAAVALVARYTDQLDESARQIQSTGGRAVALAADVSDPSAVERTVREAERLLGPVDLLVNNAGSPGPFGPSWEVDPAEWWRCQEVNLRGPFMCARAILPGMVERRRGRIVNMASGAGTQAVPYMSAYVASKTALIRFTENLASEVEAHGIHVFATDPGNVRTAMLEHAMHSETGQRWLPWLRTTIEAGHHVPPERAARLILQLASGQADALSGCYLSILDDVGDLIERAEEVKRDALQTLRLRTLD